MATNDPAYGLIDQGAIVVDHGKIIWVGQSNAVPSVFDDCQYQEFSGRLATPGLIDSHTHLVFAGNRAAEFEDRLKGKSYAEIARAGGGILATVKATRSASDQTLVDLALPRLDALMNEGVSTIEMKSGYGLELDSELKMLRAARQLARERNVRVVTSLLAAHAVPPEYEGRPDAYIDLICDQILPAAYEAELVDAVDGFCESIGFTIEQMARVFECASNLGLPVKLHAEQLSNLGGAALAARFGALSADHLEYLDDDGIGAMAESGTVATLLPGAFYTLGETQLPPVDALRTAKVPIVVATDCNPGSSPIFSLLLTMNMACTMFRLTPEEALAGTTRFAARALGLAGELGTIEVGKKADLAIWDIEHPAELSYQVGINRLHQRFFGGER